MTRLSDDAASAFTRLVDIMATLRSPDGCPWDREQTIESIAPFVLEETYEVLDAIDRRDHAALCGELGDFVFEAVFLAQLESEAGQFTIADSLTSIADKLVRRHPHVFARGDGEPALESAGQVRARWEDIKAGERTARDASAARHTLLGGIAPGQVKVRWEEIKAQERGGSAKPKTLLSGIAPALPALLRAYHIGLRAASVNFDWTRVDDVVGKIQEEVDELREVVDASAVDAARAEEEMGDLLFSIANLARKLGIDPETALRKANDKFTRRFTAMESTIAAEGRTMREMTLDELEERWQSAKRRHQNPRGAP
jgi:nucleoside triphosphate diphosphatase